MKYDFAPVCFHSHVLHADREQMRWDISALSRFTKWMCTADWNPKIPFELSAKNDAASQLCYSSSCVAVELHLNTLTYVNKHNCSNHLLCMK